MPIYEYYCPKCKRKQELLQKINDPIPLCVCEEGDPVEMIKAISKGTFILKGSGWYHTDYKNKT